MSEKFPFKALIFEGGGALAPAHLGAAQVFADNDILKNVKYFAGSSSGSMIATVLASGASLAEAKQEILQTDFNLFLDDGEGCKGVCRMVKNWGWYKGDYIENQFNNFLEKATGKKDLTFAELFECTGNELIITAVDLTTGELLLQSKDNTPDLPVKTAVRRSISLPLIYEPNVAQEDDTKRYYIDGGTLNNYPIRVFDDKLRPEEVVGFKLLNSPGEDQVGQTVKTAPVSLFDYTYRFLAMLIEKSNAVHVDEKDWERSVKIKVEKYSSLNFDITLHDKRVMMESGKLAAEKFLEKYQN